MTMTNSQTLKPFKRGDTFAISCTYKKDGIPTALTGMTVRSQIRSCFNKSIVSEMTVTVSDQATSPGVFAITAPDADTSSWPLGNLVCDLQITNGTTIRSTDSFNIPVIEDVTR